MNILYFWVRRHKNIQHLGFNLSSKAFISAEVFYSDEISDGTIDVSLNIKEDLNVEFNIFPENIIDVKAVLGENGSGKSSLLFWLINFFMNDRTTNFGFLVTEKYIFVRDKIKFTSDKYFIGGKLLKIVYPEDIINFDRDSFKRKIEREEAFTMVGRNLMETYFKKSYLIYYSTTLNQDNYYNSDGVQNSYYLWQSESTNYFDISTESLIVSDYANHKNTPEYFLSGESELLSFKYSESLRMLNFLADDSINKLDLKFGIHTVNIGFTGFNEIFWSSIDRLVSNNSSQDRTIERILKFGLTENLQSGYTNAFIETLRQEIMYCILSFQLKHSYNFTEESEYPLFRLIKNLELNYDSRLEPWEAVYNYIKLSDWYFPDSDYLIRQIQKTKDYFITKFSAGDLIPNGIHGLIVPNVKLHSIASDFLQPHLSYYKISEDFENGTIKLNMFGFDFYGLSTGERSFLSLFSRLHYYRNRIKGNRNLLFLIDEGELGFHPQWQKEYFKILIDFFAKIFPENKIQFIITSHSPFLASDLPKENIIFLTKESDNKASITGLKMHKETFAANIHSLYSDAFFIQGATIGSFAKDTLDQIVDYLNGDKFTTEQNVKYKTIIQKIGEPIIKNKLEEMWMQKLGKDEEISLLEARIKYLKSI
ncbi:AAA family ATPase [Flavobacterium rakeshii]|uniref:AAA family ATPase n=1 Tax=Flavobacterium rakeshii TaxID=1038845 RepID=UPI002E7C2F03|nr:AAA family ATPase [Flavobacterium rakeshii]MEE1898686.1 AAA family ATPase [Flavobacterium rakeshii]